MHTPLTLGDPAPAIALPDARGVEHGLAQIAPDAPVVVMFLCNHCPYVKHVAPALGEAAERWRSAGVALIGVNSNDTQRYPADAPPQMVTFARDSGWTFPYLVDDDQSVAESYGAMCTPDAFVFDGEHRLVYRGQLDSSRPSNGTPVTFEDIDRAIAAALAGEAVPEPQRPSIGCSIKWKPGNGPQ